jgi:hypothetical protein
MPTLGLSHKVLAHYCIFTLDIDSAPIEFDFELLNRLSDLVLLPFYVPTAHLNIQHARAAHLCTKVLQLDKGVVLVPTGIPGCQMLQPFIVVLLLDD